MAARYTIDTQGDIALSATTPKTILNVINGTNALVRLIEMGVGFDGTSATAEPITVELCKSTQATAGTSTSTTPNQTGGPTRTVQASGARNYTVEPTVLTVIKRWLVHPQGLPLVIQFPLGREPEQTASGQGLCLRCTAPATVNVQAYMEFEEG